MVRQIPFHAIESPTGPTFRGPWREYGQIVAYEDFTTTRTPGLVTSRWVSGGTNNGAIEATYVPIGSTPAANRPNIPGASVATHVSGSNVFRALEVDLGLMGIPAGIEVTKVMTHAYRDWNSSSAPMYQVVDGVRTSGALPSLLGWHPTALTFAAGVTSASKIGFESAYLTIGLTAVTVYGTSVTDYRMGDTVSYLGKLWQSLADNNNDEPGTTLRWIDLGSLQAPNTSLYTVTERFVAANNGTNTFALGAHPSTVLNVHWAGLSQPAAHWDVTNTTLTLHDTEGYVKSGDPVSITYSLTQT